MRAAVQQNEPHPSNSACLCSQSIIYFGLWLDKHLAGLKSLLKKQYNANSGTSDPFLPEDWPLATKKVLVTGFGVNQITWVSVLITNKAVEIWMNPLLGTKLSWRVSWGLPGLHLCVCICTIAESIPRWVQNNALGAYTEVFNKTSQGIKKLSRATYQGLTALCAALEM